MYRGHHISVVIPAYNEQDSIGLVVEELRALQFELQPMIDLIVVCDNRSSDNTTQNALAAGADVIYEPQPGYGSACLAALAQIKRLNPTLINEKGTTVVFVDGDHSLEALELPTLLDPLINGADLVIGSRQLGTAQPGSMSPQQILGNRFATFLMRLIWRQNTTDLGPFRAIRMDTLDKLNMADRAYGWTMEMQAKAYAAGMQVIEVPVSSICRIGKSKISGTWRGTFGAMWGILGTLAKISYRSALSQRQQQNGIEENSS